MRMMNYRKPSLERHSRLGSDEVIRERARCGVLWQNGRLEVRWVWDCLGQVKNLRGGEPFGGEVL